MCLIGWLRFTFTIKQASLLRKCDGVFPITNHLFHSMTAVASTHWRSHTTLSILFLHRNLTSSTSCDGVTRWGNPVPSLHTSQFPAAHTRALRSILTRCWTPWVARTGRFNCRGVSCKRGGNRLLRGFRDLMS